MMAKLRENLLLVAIFLSFCGLSLGKEPFQFFQLVLTWPPSYCKVPGFCAYSPLPNDFVIHGFWPDNFDGPQLKFCRTKKRYDSIQDPELLLLLNTHWAHLVRGADSNNDKWFYQWRKHGTCALPFYSQMVYFKLAVRLRTQYDLKGHLARNNIVPSAENMYSVSNILSVVRQLTGKDAWVICSEYDETNQQISEIKLCFERSGDIIDCPSGRWIVSCLNADVYYPPMPAG